MPQIFGHISFTLVLKKNERIRSQAKFLLFGLRKSDDHNLPPKAWYRLDGVPLIDIMFAVLAVGAAMYLPLLPPVIVSERVGNPSQFDVFMGTALLLLTLEATRRSVGPT